MARQGSGIKRAVILVCLLALAACTTIYRNHGYVPREEDLAKVVVGESRAWYYVGSRFRYYAGRAPKEVDRQVVAISFDDKGVVENVERFGLEKGEVVVISRRVTDSNIKGVGFLRQLLGNIGNFNAGQFLDQTN
jgi:outer membrane protein assembly factor BamE (lipoprotein component of BamABCDE complex)